MAGSRDDDIAAARAALERGLQDPTIVELVAAAPDPTPEQLALLRRLFADPPGDERSEPAP